MSMKTSFILTAALASALALAACDQRDTTPEATAPADSPSADVAPSPDVAVPTDATGTAADTPAVTEPASPAPAGSSQGEALGLLIAVNEHEIAAADQARTKGVEGKVLDFANMMTTDHRKNLADTRKLAGTANTDTPAVAIQRSKGQAELDALNAKADDAYEKAYVDAMVKGHGDVLLLIDSKLLPAASDAAVKQHFIDTRAAVAHHLDEARKLQGK